MSYDMVTGVSQVFAYPSVQGPVCFLAANTAVGDLSTDGAFLQLGAGLRWGFAMKAFHRMR